MKKIDFKIATLLIFLGFIFSFNSCINNDYEIGDNITDNIVVGGDSLILPVGSTGKILMSNILDADEIDLLKVMENGSYGFFTNDSLNVNVDKINTDNVNLNQEIQSNKTISFKSFTSDPTILGFTNIIATDIPQTNTKVNIVMPAISKDVEPMVIPLEEKIDQIFSAYPTGIKPEYIDIPKINVPLISGQTEISINNIVIPENIIKINTLYPSTKSNYITFDISANYLPILKSNTDKGLTIDTLKIKFPENFIFEDQGDAKFINDDNEYILTSYSFSDSQSKKNLVFHLKNIDCSKIDQSNGNFNYEKEIKYSCSSYFQGSVKTENVTNPQINISIGSVMTFDDANITTKNITKPLETQKTDFEINSYIGSITHIDTLSFKENPSITIQFVYPDKPFEIKASDIKIKFPDFFVFEKNENLNRTTNIYTLNGDLSDINLKIKSLALNRDLDKGFLIINDQITVDGAIELESTQLTTNQISSFENESIKIVTNVDKMKIDNAVLDLSTITESISGSEKLNISTFLPKEIIKLDSIVLNPKAKLSLNLKVSGLPLMNDNKIKIEASVSLPKIIRTSTSQNIVNSNNTWKVYKYLTINDDNRTGTLNQEINITSLDFTQKNYLNDDSITINEDVPYEIVFYIIKPKGINTAELSNLKVTLNVKLSDLELNTAYGEVNPEINDNHSTVKIDGIPDFLQDDDIVLDIKNPIIKIVSKSNIGIPINASILLKSYVDGIVKEKQTIELNLKKAKLGENLEQDFWIANNVTGVEQGYSYIQSDLSKLFRSIPDSISLDVSTKTDKSEQHIIDLTKDLNINIDYNVVVPLSFGKDLSINKDTIVEIEDDIVKIIRDNSAKLTGIITNTIPVKLKIKIIPMDENNTPLANIEPIIQSINAGGAKLIDNVYVAEPIKTTLNLNLKNDEGQYDKIKNFLITITGLAPTLSSSPIKPNDYVNISLSAIIPGGLNISKIIDDDNK